MYFDIFDHPLTKVEIVKLAAGNSSEMLADASLNELVQAKMLHEIDGYYSVQPEFKSLIERRETGERNAALQKTKAHKRAKFIGKFPYVKAAYISGSMSKGVMHEDGDIDFFIITEPGRLWVARTFLVLFKKTFLFNSRKFFCLNYFIDSSKLEIEEKNVFTATEMVTLKPIYDSGIYSQFRDENSWVEEFIPNNKREEVVYNGKTSRPIANLVEGMLNNSIGDKLDEWFMTGTLKVWKRKFKHLENVDFDVALKTRKYVSKHHPRNFQSRVLGALDERILRFEEKHNTKLS
ncbi:MAG: nucleotidyltransferase domain-containing protein [Flavobacteriales bacterium]